MAKRGRPGGAAQAAGQRGWIQKRIARAFAGYGPELSTVQLAEHVFPRMPRIEKCFDWYRIRRACERVAVGLDRGGGRCSGVCATARTAELLPERRLQFSFQQILPQTVLETTRRPMDDYRPGAAPKMLA